MTAAESTKEQLRTPTMHNWFFTMTTAINLIASAVIIATVIMMFVSIAPMILDWPL